MKTLVVGHMGFIGSYLMEEIEAEGLDLKQGENVINGIEGKYKIIIFLACNQDDTLSAYEENLAMYTALDAYRWEHPKTYLIYISSATVYESGGAYTQSKRIGEYFARKFNHYIILRLSNVYGHGDGHGAPDRFIRGEKTINGNGYQVRDLISVEEVVDTIVTSTRYLSLYDRGTFNVSSGKPTTVNDMFKLWGKGEPKYYTKANYGTDYSVLKPGRVYD